MNHAFIDIGTNSIRYLAARIKPGEKPQVIARGLEVPRLGSGGKRLETASIERGLSSLRKIIKILEPLEIDSWTAIGTEALRRAPNADEFLREAAALGLDVRVISGEEEASLVKAGALKTIAYPPEEILLVDIGGGSSEFVRGQFVISMPLGCVDLLDRYGDEMTGARREARRILAKISDDLFRQPLQLVGLGGTLTTLAAIKLGMREYDGDAVNGLVLTRTWLEQTIDRITALPLSRRRDVPGLPEDRADILPAGTAIALEVLARASTDRITVSDRGLLWGLLEKKQKPGVRIQ